MDEFDDELLALANDGVESEEEGEASSHDSPRSAISRSPSRSVSRSPVRRRSPSPRRSVSRTISRSPQHASPPTKQHSPRRSNSASNNMSRARGEGRRKDESEEEGEASDAPGSPDSMGSVAMDESDSEASDNEGSGNKGGETVFERERRLAEQAEREEERRKTAQLKAVIAARDTARADPSKSTKRKAEVDDDDYDRRASRQRTKKDEPSGRRAVRRKGLSETPPADYAEEQVKRPDPKLPGTLAEYERVRMGRSRFANVCFTPGFADTFVGAFARVCSSQDPMTGQNTYRICQIKEFKKGRPYKLEAGDGSKYMTDQYVVASYGTLDREYPFNACSDSRFTEDEFHRRISMLQNQDIALTTAQFLASKCKDINEFLDRPKTQAEITQKIANQNRLAHLLVQNGNVLAVGPQTLQRDLAVHKRNLDNRKLNEEQVRKALMADRRKRIQFAEHKARLAKEEEERKRKAEEDELFGDASAEVKPFTATPKISKYVQRDPKNGLCSFTRVKNDDEIIASMDIDIDIDI